VPPLAASSLANIDAFISLRGRRMRLDAARRAHKSRRNAVSPGRPPSLEVYASTRERTRNQSAARALPSMNRRTLAEFLADDTTGIRSSKMLRFTESPSVSRRPRVEDPSNEAEETLFIPRGLWNIQSLDFSRMRTLIIGTA